METLLSKLLGLLAALWTWLAPKLEPFMAGFGLRAWLEQRKNVNQLEKDNEALRDVLGIRTRVERMSDAEIREYGRKNGLSRVGRRTPKL